MRFRRWYRGSGKRYGLVMGYNNVRSYEEAVELLERQRTPGCWTLNIAGRAALALAMTYLISIIPRQTPTSLSCSSCSSGSEMRRVRLMRYQRIVLADPEKHNKRTF